MPTFFRVIVFAAGAALVAASFWLRAMNARAQSWSATRGRILKCELPPDPHDAGSSVELSYQYKVGARTFTSSRVAFAAFRNDANSKAALVARFPSGSEVEVFYDPRNPSNAVLLREPSNLWLWVTTTGAAFVGVATLVP
jgi:Protein of unknown function (DUF3592)